MPSVTVGSTKTIHFQYPGKEEIIKTNKRYGIMPSGKTIKRGRKTDRRKPMSLAQFSNIFSSKEVIKNKP
jgi:hypothetical protein